MEIFIAGKTTRKTTHPRKLTELEKNIQFLEQKEVMFPYEKLRLDSLKERQVLLYGLPSASINREVNVKTIRGDKELVAKSNPTEVAEDSLADTSHAKVKQSFPSAFIVYRREKVAEVKKQNSDYRFEKDFCVGAWSKMSGHEKKPYCDQAAKEKLKLGDKFNRILVVHKEGF